MNKGKFRMAEMKKFNIDFVKRTITILENYKGEYGFSNLINCTLGLIVLPYERNVSSEIFKKNITEIDSLPSFTISIFEPIETIKNGKKIFFPKTLKVLLKKIRNGLAHQNISPKNINGVLNSIVITNKYRDHTDMVVEFTEFELKNFALFISQTYLKSYSTAVIS